MPVTTRIIRRRRNTATVDAFAEEFAFESLKSDRLRVSILIGAIVSSLLLVLSLIPIFFDDFQRAFHGNFRNFLVAVFVIFGLNLGYLIAERVALSRRIKK